MRSLRPATSVFTDDSGRRTRWVTWATRSAVGILLTLGAVVVLSLTTQVGLPGLSLPSSLAGIGHGDTERSQEAPRQSSTTPAPSSSPRGTAATTRAPGGSKATGGTAASSKGVAATTKPRPVATPATPATAGHGRGSPHPKATDTPRAHPTHMPGTPPATPPGKSK